MSYPKEKQTFSESQSPPYPSQHQQMGPQQMGQYPPPAYPFAPPPYSSNPSPVQAPQYQSQYMYSNYSSDNMMNPGPPPPYSFQQHSYSVGYPTQGGYAYQQTQNVIATARFDSGARFDGIATQHIPPPPPGCAPNAAQMAVAQGGTVVATQKKASWFTGGSGGGVSFW
ncbi:hypothetical protein Btru_059779 [Bulinus truncatus]|nr:hypothetical protein Btru_059779 [Bulinus truncatus]